MTSFIIVYDLDGPSPSYRDVDDLLGRLGARRARVFETVWWVDCRGTATQLRDQMRSILRSEDSLLVCECTSAAWQSLQSPGPATSWVLADRRSSLADLIGSKSRQDPGVQVFKDLG